MKSFTNLFILFFILIVLGFLYKSFEDKRIREENKNINKEIQNYLLDDVTLGKSKKPILWIHIPYEYNSRKWASFGSRSSFDLNQPYLYLTVKSIIAKCDHSFTICIVDDNAFQKLIPGWNIDMTKISDPILSNMRTLGMAKLLYRYGGLICPVSFLCMKDLNGLYNKGTRGNKLFLCETTDRNITSTEFDYYPSFSFCGAPKESNTVMEFCDFIQRVMSRDFTAESVFLGDFNRWCNARIKSGRINMINGLDIGTKTVQDKPILVEDLLSNNYLDLYPNTYGILIPANEILMRRNYEWFARLSTKQVVESDTILGNYFLLSLAPKEDQGILEPLKVKPKWVGFWRTPLQDVYGLKPNFLGDNLLHLWTFKTPIF
jgi:hypothetical protein